MGQDVSFRAGSFFVNTRCMKCVGSSLGYFRILYDFVLSERTISALGLPQMLNGFVVDYGVHTMI